MIRRFSNASFGPSVVAGCVAAVLVLSAELESYGDTIYSNVSIPANAEISGAGNAGLPDGSGVLPLEFNLPANPGVLTMTSVTGDITLNGGGGQNDPDGVVVSGAYGLSLPGASQMNAYGGLSGIKGPGAGYLVGVFETSSSVSGVAPASLDFVASDAGGIATSFSSLSPLLNQVFYIGDGLTGDGTGSVQTFNVPSGATRLFLGISDAPGFEGGPGAYSDNSGNFTATFAVTAVPEPSTARLATIAALGLIGFVTWRRATSVLRERPANERNLRLVEISGKR